MEQHHESMSREYEQANILDYNSETSSILVADDTRLLKETKKKTSKRTNISSSSSSSSSRRSDGDKLTNRVFDDTVELKNVIQRKPYLCAIALCSTLSFGFAIGFSTVFVAFKRGYFQSTDDTNQVQHVDTTATATATTDLFQTSIVNQKSTNEDHKIWEYIESFMFQDHSTLLTSSSPSQPSPPSSSSKITTTSKTTGQSGPLLRFPFQGGTTQPRPIIYLNRPDAYALLIDAIPGGTSGTSPSMSEYSSDFFLISSGLDVQINSAYCGAASSVAILNSLRFLRATGSDGGVDGVTIPVDPAYTPHLYATQSDIFNQCTETSVISHAGGGGPGVDGILTPPYGLSMPQVAGVLRCHLNTTTTSGIGWDVFEQYVDKSHITAGKVRYDLKNALSDPNSRVLVNYDRSSIGQVGGGHWSPVGSYSDKLDAFLILDVGKYKYPPVWIPTERLFDALATYDDCGSWNFPDGQDRLSQEERTAHTTEGYAATLVKLDCEKKLRGYITVTRT
jgi:hypothetical protein